MPFRPTHPRTPNFTLEERRAMFRTWIGRSITPMALALATLTTGCASLPGTETETVAGRHIEYALSKLGPQTVVFENGLGGTLNWWAKVVPDVSKSATTFAYNRPGYGSSERAATPRDGAHIVDELRATLRSKGLNPPYVLVGHSLGGLYMQFFAKRYPDEVSGLVLVDSTHPAQLRGSGNPEQWPAWFRVAFALATSAVEREELQALDATGESVLDSPPFTDKPVLILSASKPMQETSELANYANEMRRDLARLYPGSRHIWVDSGHGIPLEKPDAVIAAIYEVLANGRATPSR